jgi:hypothetical protein
VGQKHTANILYELVPLHMLLWTLLMPPMDMLIMLLANTHAVGLYGSVYCIVLHGPLMPTPPPRLERLVPLPAASVRHSGVCYPPPPQKKKKLHPT